MNNNIEQLNRIELCGTIGSIRLNTVGDKRFANFTLATNYAYRDKEGCPVIETTWHSVSAWEGDRICDLDRLVRGCTVHVTGRIRNQRYMNADGLERTSVIVLAHSLSLVP